MSAAANDELKFGPAPERGVPALLAAHFAACLVVLYAVRPPFVSDGKRTNHLLVILLSAVLSCAVAMC